MPLPLNQKTNRLSIACSFPAGVSAAYAAPFELNMQASGGSPTTIRAPERDNPFSRARRDKRKRLVITCDMNAASLFRREFPCENQRSDEFLKMKLRAPEIRRHLVDQRPVAGSIQASGDITKVLLDDTLLALRSPR